MTLRAVGFLFVLLSAAASAQPVADTVATPPLDADSVAVDSAETVRAEAAVDSAAVAALNDTDGLDAALGDGVAVTLLGNELFSIWNGLGDVSADTRARRLSLRLGELAQNREIDTDSLRLVQGSEFTTIQVGDAIVMSVTDDDAVAQGLTRAQAAERYRQRIADGVVRYREQATLQGVARGAGLTALLLVALVLALRGIGWIFSLADRRTARVRRRLIRPVRLGTLEVISRTQVARLGRALVALVRLAISLVLVYVFLTTVFGFFPWTQTWSDNLLDAALTPLRQIGAALVASVDNVVAIVVIIAIIRWTIRFSDYLFTQIETGDVELRGFHADLADPTRKIAKFLLVIAGIMLVYPYTPIADNRGFQGLTVFFGILLSIGSSTAISNMVAGVVLTYTRAFRLGDRVKVGDTFGDVVEKTFLVTRIRTPKNEDISVPNAMVLTNHIVNYSVMAREGSGVVLHTEITIGYDVPWPQVHRLLIGAAHDTEGIASDPPPFVLQTSLGDFSVAYQLNAYTHEVGRMARLYSDIHQHIQDRFAEADVEILSPTYHARRDGPSTVPDPTALRNHAHRAEATTRAGHTDGADVQTEPVSAPSASVSAQVEALHKGTG